VYPIRNWPISSGYSDCNGGNCSRQNGCRSNNHPASFQLLFEEEITLFNKGAARSADAGGREHNGHGKGFCFLNKK